jgi:tetratricopeptide (TPR) repeat protein
VKHKIVTTFTILISLAVVGCTSYQVPEGSKVVISKEDLPSYNPKNFAKNTSVNYSAPKGEDNLIIKAIFLEEQHYYKESNKYYTKLYDLTKQNEYLIKEFTTARSAGIGAKHLNELKMYAEKHPDDLASKRLLLSFYLQEKNFQQAKQIGNELTQNSKQAVDFELAANPYIFTEEYAESLVFLKEAYNKTLNEDILLKIVTIQINYMKHVDDAIMTLEEHRQKQGCSEKICLQLAAIYSQQSKVDKVIPIYKDLYKSTHKDIYLEKIIEGYLFNLEINSAIQYLEEDHKNDELLYSLYMEKKAYGKANELTRLLLSKTHDPKWYAESAISYYESLSNQDDKTKLKKVVNDFEKAIELGEKNPIYLNYYGYTLIDKDLDVNKGLKIIEQALKQEPENTYFLDSLAWGNFKLNNCEVAYSVMKKVVEVEGLNEEEIVGHWNAINNKCKEQ